MSKATAALPDLELKHVSLRASLRNKGSQSRELSAAQAETLAAEVFDEALIRAGIGTEEAALIVGVSKSLVSRWRSDSYREQPSYAQLLRLPAHFQYAMHKVANQRFGFGRAALLDLLDAAGQLAVAVGE